MACVDPTFLAVRQAQAPARTRAREYAQHLDAALFGPGVYRVPAAPPTPAAILSGAYRGVDAEERIEYFPRRPAFCGRPCLSIAFTVGGHPAPYLKDIVKNRVLLDGAHDAVMADQGWSRTRWLLEWPGYENPVSALPVAGLTRAVLAKEVARAVFDFLRVHAPLGAGNSPWAPRNVHYGDVRLVAMNYYGRAWVPVLAFDAM
ncbi:hypothetical protein GGX14DRAFT_669845, partial [Mycena pura]